MIEATEIPMNHGDFNRKLWKLSEPVEYDYDLESDSMKSQTNYVITSHSSIAHEVLIFPADAVGQIIDWGEIGGIRGTADHYQAINSKGWEVS